MKLGDSDSVAHRVAFVGDAGWRFGEQRADIAHGAEWGGMRLSDAMFAAYALDWEEREEEARRYPEKHLHPRWASQLCVIEAKREFHGWRQTPVPQTRQAD